MADIDMEDTVIDNEARSRFELTIGGQTAFADYRRTGERLVISYVEAPKALRGTGTAGRLMEGVLAVARAESRKVVPLCGYAEAYMTRHPEHHDLLI